MVTEITLNTAFGMYQAELERQMVGLNQSDRISKRYSAYVERTKKTVFLSIVDLIREVQNHTEIGKVKTIEYVQQLQTASGDPLYMIV